MARTTVKKKKAKNNGVQTFEPGIPISPGVKIVGVASRRAPRKRVSAFWEGVLEKVEKTRLDKEIANARIAVRREKLLDFRNRLHIELLSVLHGMPPSLQGAVGNKGEIQGELFVGSPTLKLTRAASSAPPLFDVGCPMWKACEALDTTCVAADCLAVDLSIIPKVCKDEANYPARESFLFYRLLLPVPGQQHNEQLPVVRSWLRIPGDRADQSAPCYLNDAMLVNVSAAGAKAFVASEKKFLASLVTQFLAQVSEK